MQRVVAVCLVALAFLAAGVTPGLAATGGATGHAAVGGPGADGPPGVDGPADRGIASLLQTGDVDPDAVILTADLQPDGDAVWTIEYRVRLDDQNATDAFESLQTDIQANRSAYAAQFAERMRSTVSAAENFTGREMAVENATVRAQVKTIPQRYGVITYQFTWAGFAAVDGERLAVGDALSGFFLDKETRLTVRWPQGYAVSQVAPPPDDRSDRSVTWVGPQDFSGGQPTLVVAPAGPLPVSTPVAVGAALVLVLLVGGVWWWRRRRGAGAGGATAGAAAQPGGSGGEAGSAEAAGAGAGGGTTAGGAGEEPPPDELLSPEERVLRLLAQRGGRMKQKEVTDELDWSAARTSQVVGDLRDSGDVETFRIGRENVLRLPDDDGEGKP